MTSRAHTTRLRPPRITPVELWDAPVGGRPLQSHRGERGFTAALTTAVRAVREQPPPSWPDSAREQARKIEHVYLTGGGACEIAPSLNVRHTLSTDPIFGAARAGLSLPRCSACVDLGQTSIKIAVPGRAWRVERDLVATPRRDDVAPSERPRVRAATIEFLAGALREIADATHVVLALPCEIDDSGGARGCTYCWRDREPALAEELVTAAGATPSAISILNDAELAAMAADCDPALPRGGVVLVLTIGFGVGAALLDARR